MLGIGLGGFASGFEKGVGIADKMRKASRERELDNAVDQGKSDYESAVADGTAQPGDANSILRFTMPKIMAPLIKQGDLEGAQKASAWLQSDDTRRATESFGKGMVAAQAGDMKTALDNFVAAGRTKGYGPDIKIDDPQPIEGGGYRVNVGFKDGRTVTKDFKSPDDVIQFGATNLNPVQAWQTMQAERTADKDAARGVTAATDKYRNTKGIDLQDDQTRKAAGLDAVTTGTQLYKNKRDIDAEGTDAEIESDTKKYQGRKNVDLDYETRQRAAGLGPSSFEPQNVVQTGPDGKPVVKPYVFDRRRGTAAPMRDDEGNDISGEISRPGGRGGAGGRDSVFQQRLKVGEGLYGAGSKEAADYANGRRQVTPGEAMRFGINQAETELRNDPTISQKFKSPADRTTWKNTRASEIANTISSAQTPAAPAKETVTSVSKPQDVPTDMPGVGTRGTPFQATTQPHVDWFKKNAQPGQVIIIDGKAYTK